MSNQRPVPGQRVSRPRYTARSLVGSGLAIIAASLLISMVWHVSQDPRRAAETAGASPVRLVPPPEIAVSGGIDARVSREDRAFLRSNGGSYDMLLQGSREVLTRLGMEVRLTDGLPASAESGRVLLLDHAFCFDSTQWDSLLAFLDAGGGVLSVGPVAVRDGAGRWLGWDRMLDLLQAREAHEVATSEIYFITVGKLGPITATEDQGLRIALNRGASVLGLEAADPAAYWSGYHREPLPYPDRPWAAALCAVRGKGRISWIGFPPAWINEDPENEEGGLRWISGLIRWVQGEAPLAVAEAWPGRAGAAVLLEQDTEMDFGNAAGVLDLLERRGLPATFSCVSNLAEKEPELVRRMARLGEVASHTDDHRALTGKGYGTQKKHLTASARSLRKLSGSKVSGFRPPEEKFDQETLRAMKTAGYDYLFGASDAPWAQPRLIDVGGGTAILRIPRLTPDDYQFLEARPVPEDSIPALFLAALDRVRLYRGVDLVSIHTHLLGRPVLQPHLEAFLDSLSTRPVWAATGGELADWWRRRSNCRIECVRLESGGYLLSADNPSAEEIRGLSVRLSLPRNPGSVIARRDAAGTAATVPSAGEEWLSPDARGVFQFVVDPLPGGEEMRYRLCVAEPGPDAAQVATPGGSSAR